MLNTLFSHYGGKIQNFSNNLRHFSRKQIIHTESVVVMNDEEDYEEKLWREEQIRKTNEYLESIKDAKAIYEQWLDKLRKEEE